MAKAIFTATDPNGAIHKRTSAKREYTHTVVYQEDKAAYVAAATSPASRKQHEKNAQYYLDCIANGEHLNLMTFAHYVDDEAAHARDVEEAVKRLDGATTAAEFAEARIAEDLERYETIDWSKWINAGWCGRLDLAQKLAASTGSMSRVSAFKVLEATKA